MINRCGKFIHSVLINIFDFFFPVFQRWMPKEVYHYLACGTINTLSDWVLYFLIYNYVVHKQIVDLDFIAFSPHIASLIIVTPITFFIGFCLSKYVTFTQSNIQTNQQIKRYAYILAANFLISYFGLKLCCEVLNIWATPAKMITTVFTTLFSYFTQKYYSFKKKE